MNDRYTKCVLTVIAAALCWIGFELSTGNARAQSGGGGTVTQVAVLARRAQDRQLGDLHAELVYCANCTSPEGREDARPRPGPTK